MAPTFATTALQWAAHAVDLAKQSWASHALNLAKHWQRACAVKLAKPCAAHAVGLADLAKHFWPRVLDLAKPCTARAVGLAGLAKPWAACAVKLAMAGTVITAGGPALASIALHVAGFTFAGIAAGSYAAAWQSAIALANGTGVVAGSLFAMLQSAGMTLAPLMTPAAGLLRVIAAAIAAAYYFFKST